MPTPTYDLIASTTLAASTSELVFASLPQTYRDLILVIAGTVSGSGTGGFEVEINGTQNSTAVWMRGFPSSFSSGTDTNFLGLLDATGQSNFLAQFFDYSATDKHKTFLTKSNSPAEGTVWATAGRWANTAAITSIKILDTGGRTLQTGLTASIYGIAA